MNPPNLLKLILYGLQFKIGAMKEVARDMRRTTPTFLTRLDSILGAISKEKIPENGEDAWFYSANCDGIGFGVFDGCGGAGAKTYAHFPNYQGKTGAYLASRITANAVKAWFSENAQCIPEDAEQLLKLEITKRLRFAENHYGEQASIKSRMIKAMPTTAAFAFLYETRGAIQADCFWAGDSRLYLLNQDGLAQITTDDLSVSDAMDNLYTDGTLTNCINLSVDFTIHRKLFTLRTPTVIFAATDGCFGYMESPMEFEYALLNSLYPAGSMNDWKQNLDCEFQRVAGDDYTLCGAVIGYGSFQNLWSSLMRRKNDLEQMYINPMDGMTRQEKTALWNRYKKGYYRLIGENS